MRQGYLRATKVLRNITRPGSKRTKRKEDFLESRLHLVGRKSRVAEPINSSLDDLDVLVGRATADTDAANKVVVLVDGKTTTKDNKTTVGFLNTCTRESVCRSPDSRPGAQTVEGTLSGSIQVGCCVGTVEQNSGTGLLDGDINAARESIVHAVESNQHTTGINNSHVFGNDRVGLLHGSSNEAVSFIN
jgi:hypothetical protein